MAHTKASAASDAGQNIHDAATSPGVLMLARFGYAAKGTVYIVIGLLAALVALGKGGATTDRNGAIQTIDQQPFGKFLLIVVGAGLLSYAIWKFIQAAVAPDGAKNDFKGIAKRLVYAGIGISYGGLALASLQLALGSGSGGKSSDQKTQDWTAKLLSQPFGQGLAILAGLVVLGVAGFQFYEAYSAKFQKHLKLWSVSKSEKKWAVQSGRFGYASRGVVFGLIGLFIIVAALEKRPDQAKGFGGALQLLSAQTYGQVLLGVVAVGLVAYGVFSIEEARYRYFGGK